MKTPARWLPKLKSSLYVKLAVSLLLVSTITYSITSYMTYNYLLQAAEHEIGEQFVQNMEQLQARLSLRLREIYRISSFFNFEPYVIRALQEKDQAARYQDDVQLQRLMTQVMIDTPNILGVYLYDLEGNIHRSTVTFLSPDLIEEIYDLIIRRVEPSDGELVWFRYPYFHYYQNSSRNDIIVAARKLKDSRLQTFGTFVIILHERFFENDLKDSIRGNDAYVYLFDNNNQLIYTDDDNEPLNLPPMPRINPEITDYAGKQYMIAFSRSDQTRFTLVSRISMETLRENSKVIFRTAIINGVVIVAFASGLLLLAIRTFLNPLKQLVSGMKSVRMGLLNTRVHIQSRDELSFLADSFNSMVDELNRLIKEVYEKQLLLREAELSALQTQLNPHFLYNTLDLFHSRLYLYGDAEAADSIVGLSRMLRYALEPTGSMTTMSRELEHLQDYLRIQQLRFDDQLSIRVQVDEELLGCEIPRLLLQPIVENAFVHAFENRSDVKEIAIAAGRKGDFLVIEIMDNGCGMDPETVNRINENGFRELPISSRGDSIGLFNVQRRIHILYGPPHRLEVSSRLGQGTTVTLYLPHMVHQQEGRGWN